MMAKNAKKDKQNRGKDVRLAVNWNLPQNSQVFLTHLGPHSTLSKTNFLALP
jgi:hypothetical protein